MQFLARTALRTLARRTPICTTPYRPPIAAFHALAAKREEQAPPKKHAIGRINRRLQITFTCTASLPPLPALSPAALLEESTCNHRSTHEFSRVSYEKGIVLIECPSCKNRHLIADNLSWFDQTPSPAHPNGLPLNTPKHHRTIEDLMKEKGEKVVWKDEGAMGGTWTVEG